MQRLTRLSLAHPVAATVVIALVTATLGAGVLRLETDVGYRSLLGEHHPTVARFDRFLERFGGGFPVAAVWSCDETPRCESVFDDEAIAMAADVARAVAAEPAVRRVESPATSPLAVPDGDFGSVSRRLVDAPPGERPLLASRALHDSLWVRRLVNADGTVGAIVIEVATSSSDHNVAAYRALDAALAPYEAQGWVFHRVGGPVEFVVAGGELAADTARLVPAMVALIAGVLLALFRSAAMAAAALVTVGIAVGWSFGLMGWLGWPQNSVTQALAPLLLVIGVCDAIHVLARYASDATSRPDAPRGAVLAAVAGDVGRACVATSVTTAGAFASFATSGLESFVRFGWIAAFGVMAALVLTFTLLPILAAGIVPESRHTARASHLWDAVLDRIVGASRRRPGAILLATGVLGLTAAAGIGSLRVDASFEDLYGEQSRVVRWSRFVGDALRRPDTLEVELAAPPDAVVSDPAVLRVVERVADSLAEVEGLGPSRSLADAVSLAHQLANDDEPFWRRIPTRRDDLREIYDTLAERDAGALARLADLEARRFRVTVESEKLPQDAMRAVLAEVSDRLDATLPEGWSAELTGPLAIVRDMIDEIQRTQIWSFASAAAVVVVLAALFLGSVPTALLAALPTLLPVVVTLGTMGLVGTPLDVGSAMVAAIVIGIAVDDALHLLTQYRRRRAAGEPPATAMTGAVHHVGRAVVTTSLALSAGFAALGISSWKTISSFGALSALAILCALVAVVVVLPALVQATAGRRG